MSVIQFIVVLLVLAIVISLVFSFLGLVVVGALRLLPLVLIVLAAAFFLRGGKIDIHLPDDWKRKP
ncbi:MAG: hypothetical protein SOU51_02680 [Collinsella sp.]|nr:hypothetical protein [Collinsella sp.]